MAGFFSAWKVSGLTTTEAKKTERFYFLGVCLGDHERYKNLTKDERNDLILAGEEVLASALFFEQYWVHADKSFLDDAVKFLVIYAAISEGIAGNKWEWKTIRVMSQNLYTLMDDKPKFEALYQECETFLSNLKEFVMVQRRDFVSSLKFLNG